MLTLIKSIPPKELEKLRAKPLFGLLLNDIYNRLGLMEQAYQNWQWMFQKWPNVDIVQQAYLWFIIDNQQRAQIRYTLDRWRNQLWKKSKLWAVVSAAYMEIGDYKQALNDTLKHNHEVQKDPRYLGQLADLLVQNNRPYEAYYTAQKGYYLLKKAINNQAGKITLEQQLRLTEFMQMFAPVSQTYRSILNLSKQLFRSPEVDNQIMAFALDNDSYALASYISNIHAKFNRSTPPWMTLTLALVYNDRDAMAKVLFNSPEILPHRDRVTAALRTGNIKLAEEYAYKDLKEHPQEAEMYKLFTETMLPRSNRASFGVADYNYQNLNGPLTWFNARFFITPSISLTPYTNLWWPRTIASDQIYNIPHLDESTGVVIRKYVERGWLLANIGQRSAFDSFVIAKAKLHQQINAKLIGEFSLGYNQRAEETEALLIAGRKDNIVLNFNYMYDQYNYFDTKFELDRFSGQDSSYLGAGQTFDFHWQNKFYSEYPDWNVNFYSTLAAYQHTNKALTAKMQSIIPPDIGLNFDPEIPGFDINQRSTYYMPISFQQIGFTLGFGQEYKTVYTHNWKPFGEAGLIYSWPFGLGQVYLAGLAGSVFGRDHLALFTEYSVNQQQGSQQNYTIGIRYDNYF